MESGSSGRQGHPDVSGSGQRSVWETASLQIDQGFRQEGENILMPHVCSCVPTCTVLNPAHQSVLHHLFTGGSHGDEHT